MLLRTWIVEHGQSTTISSYCDVEIPCGARSLASDLYEIRPTNNCSPSEVGLLGASLLTAIIILACSTEARKDDET
jgi:hypothetical protein